MESYCSLCTLDTIYRLFFVTGLIINKINKVQWVDFKLENVLVFLHFIKIMGLGPFGVSAPLFLRNGELLGHSPIHNVSGWSGMSIYGLLFQCASNIKIQLSVQSRHHHCLIEIVLVFDMICLKNCHLALDNNHSLPHQCTVRTSSVYALYLYSCGITPLICN